MITDNQPLTETQYIVMSNVAPRDCVTDERFEEIYIDDRENVGTVACVSWYTDSFPRGDDVRKYTVKEWIDTSTGDSIDELLHVYGDEEATELAREWAQHEPVELLRHVFDPERREPGFLTVHSGSLEFYHSGPSGEATVEVVFDGVDPRDYD
jgi:hypothetical protein